MQTSATRRSVTASSFSLLGRNIQPTVTKLLSQTSFWPQGLHENIRFMTTGHKLTRKLHSRHSCRRSALHTGLHTCTHHQFHQLLCQLCETTCKELPQEIACDCQEDWDCKYGRPSPRQQSFWFQEVIYDRASVSAFAIPFLHAAPAQHFPISSRLQGLLCIKLITFHTPRLRFCTNFSGENGEATTHALHAEHANRLWPLWQTLK